MRCRDNTAPPVVSKIEHRTDMYISNLRENIRALGGDLEIVAKFPDGEVKIANFGERWSSDSVDCERGAPEEQIEVGTIGHQSARCGKRPERENR